MGAAHGQRTGRDGRGSAAPAIPEGWVASAIEVQRASPILLRPRTARGPIRTLPNAEVTNLEVVDLAGINLLEGAGFVTPTRDAADLRQLFKRRQQLEAFSSSLVSVCQFSAQDFTLGAPPINTDQR